MPVVIHKIRLGPLKISSYLLAGGGIIKSRIGATYLPIQGIEYFVFAKNTDWKNLRILIGPGLEYIIHSKGKETQVKLIVTSG